MKKICVFLQTSYTIPTLYRSLMENLVFGGGGVEQTWLWENDAEKGTCFGPRNIS